MYALEPTTDRFTAIMHTSEGEHANGRQIPGHALVMQTDKPFRGLASFGSNFLSKFEGAELAAPILRNITIVDTPGVRCRMQLWRFFFKSSLLSHDVCMYVCIMHL